MFCLPKTAWPPTLAALRSAIQANDVNNMKSATQSLNESMQKIGQAVYSAQQQQQPPPGGQSRIVAMSFCEPRSW